MKDKFLIGELASLFNITTDTLRHYDKINLLKPEQDQDNHYRYYDVACLFKLSRILFLKNLGISLTEIEKYMQQKNSDRLQTMLKKKNDDLDLKIQHLLNLKQKINAKLAIFEHSKTNLNRIIIQPIPARYGVFIKTYGIDDSEKVKEVFKRSEHFLKKSNWLVEGQIHTSLPKEDLEKGIFNQFRYFIEINPLDEISENMVCIPKQDYACMTVIGPYSDLSKHYATLVKWIQAEGYMIAGDSIENNIVDKDYSDSEDEFITDIQIPIKRPL